MRKKTLFRVILVYLVLVLLPGCVGLNKTVRLEEYKADLQCFVYEGEMMWKEVEEAFGEPDRFPLPSAESLSENARIYEDKILIFYTEPKRIEQQGKIRFPEVVSKLEVCTKK